MKCYSTMSLTLGTARMRLTTQDRALALRTSDRRPVAIPPTRDTQMKVGSSFGERDLLPMIPPTSKRVDSQSDCSLLNSSSDNRINNSI